MLWNKIRIFVVLGIMFVFATTHAFGVIGPGDGRASYTLWTELKKSKGFTIIMKSYGLVYPEPNNHRATVANKRIADVVHARAIPDLPDLKDLLVRGGAITISMRVPLAAEITADGADKHTLKADASDADLMKMKHRIVITEVNWGTDFPHRTGAQWFELYNAGAALKANDYIRWHTYPSLDDTVVPEPGETFMWDADNNAGTADRKFVVLDRVATINRFGQRWELKGADGDTADADADHSAAPSTLTAADVSDTPTDGRNTADPANAMTSMYRKIELDATGMAYAYEGGKPKGLGEGNEASSWETSKYKAKYILYGNYKGSPGAVHSLNPGGPGAALFNMTPASISHTGIIINEVRNDSSDDNLDWIELFYNSDDPEAKPVNIENYKLSLVMGKMKSDGSYHESGDANFTETKLAVLPKYEMTPGEYVVIYNREPGKSVTFAGGEKLQDLSAKTHIKKGAAHKYVVETDLKLPAEGKFLILLRTRNSADDVGKPTNVKDYAGNGFFKRMEDEKFDTSVWPFVAWSAPGDVEDFGSMNTFASTSMSFGREAQLNAKGMYWAKSRANRVHKDDWMTFGFMGAGYDRGRDKTVDTASSPGTPGYPNIGVSMIADDKNTASTDDDYVFDGKVSISEIMYDAGPRSNLAQWIELYNSSMSETIDLAGWELEVRNERTEMGSYVNAKFTFAADTYLPPNQTLLLVSNNGANDVAENYVYNLQEKHGTALGLTMRGRQLLSAAGFHLELRAKVNTSGDSALMVVDTAGNLEISGTVRTHAWDLPERGEMRMSITRTYKGGSNPDDGLMQASWRQSNLAGASLTYYGHRDDIGSPGYRVGGPLPVSLSSFRPVRDASTGHVEITWVTQSELNNAGFNILRSESKTGEFSVINTKGLIAGHGTTSEKHVYRYTDTAAKPNVVYYYQIEDVSMDGVRTTLRTTHLRGDVSARGKLTTRWGELKSSDK